MGDSIVIMERGSRWPAWVDRQAGAESNVLVLSQQQDEGLFEFHSRVLDQLCSIAIAGHARRAILVSSALFGADEAESRRDLLMTMALVFFIATFGMNFQVTTALMSKNIFHTGAGLFGLASAVFAVGALVGALLAARRDHDVDLDDSPADAEGSGTGRITRSERELEVDRGELDRSELLEGNEPL